MEIKINYLAIDKQTAHQIPTRGRNLVLIYKKNVIS